MRNIAKKRNQIFIGIMFVSLFLWIACILLQGTDSRFYNVFFGRTGNFLAVAFALKLSPAIFGILLLSDKRYKESIRYSDIDRIFCSS